MQHEVTPSAGLKSKYPEWVVLVVTRDATGRANVMPAGWAMFACDDPCLFAVAIHKGHLTHELIQRSGEFVIAVPAPGMEEAIRYCGSRSGRVVDKFATCDLQTLPARRVQPPLIAGAQANLECVLHSQTDAGDHTIFLGQVVAAHEDDTIGARLMNFGDGLFAAAIPAPPVPRRR